MPDPVTAKGITRPFLVTTQLGGLHANTRSAFLRNWATTHRDSRLQGMTDCVAGVTKQYSILVETTWIKRLLENLKSV